MSNTLVFYPTDEGFEHNIAQLRQATIWKRTAAPKFLIVVVDGKAKDATTAHIRPDGWFTYSDDQGERRVELHQVTVVEAYFS